MPTFADDDLKSVANYQISYGHSKQCKSEVQVQMLLVKHQLKEGCKGRARVNCQNDTEHGQNYYGCQKGTVGIEWFSEGTAFREHGCKD